MSDTHMAPSPVEPPQANTPEARTVTGELKPNTSLTSTPTPVDGKTDGEKKPEDLTLATKKEAGAVPDHYEFKVPDGYELPKEVVEKVTPIFKDMKLTGEQAQKMLDLHHELVKESQEAPYKQYETMRDNWRKEVIADRQLGNGRDDLSDSTKQNINAAFNAIGDNRLVEEFKQAMNMTGVGDNPAFLRAFAALGSHFKEGTQVNGKGPSPEGQRGPSSKPPTVANAMYPNLPSSS